jgi:nucleotide-binding universal stress UspA family protein
MALHHGAVILIVHVVEELAPGTEERVAAAFGQALYAELKGRKRASARDVLIDKKVEAVRARDALARMCRENQPLDPVESALVEDITIVEGEAAAQILSLARKKACDLIVLGSRHRGRLAQTFAGSAVRKVLRDAPTPVLVVPLKPTHPQG